MPNFLLSFGKKCLVFFLAFNLVLTPDFIPQARANLTGGSEPVTSHSPAASSHPADFLAALTLPPSLGTIDRKVRADKKKDNGQTVLLIQDAHAVSDAQRSIRGLIDYFVQNYQLPLIGLEGAAGPLDTVLFRHFPDPELLEEVLETYVARGELSGAAVAAMRPTGSAIFYGLEDQAVYENAVRAFLEAASSQPALLSEMEFLQSKLNTLKTKHYSPESLELDKYLTALRDDPDQLSEALTYLKKTFAGDRGLLQKHYPHVAILMEVMGDDDPAREAIFRAGIAQLSEQLKSSLKDSDKIKEFHQKNQAYQTEHLRLDAYAHYLLRQVQKLNWEKPLPPGIQSLAARYERLLYLRGGSFFTEIAEWGKALKENHFQTEEEKQIDFLAGEIYRFRQMIRLKMSRAEWNEISAEKNTSFDFSQADPEIKNIADEMDTFFSSTQVQYPAFKEFYAFAQQRDQVMAAHLLDRMKVFGVKTAAFVTGGFHTDGVERLLREKGVSVIVITPGIQKIDDETRYLEIMQGQVSWNDYFEERRGTVDLYRAFVRAAIGRALELRIQKKQAPEEALLLRSWRDRVFSALAREGRIDEARKYAALIFGEESASIQSVPVTELRDQWMDRIERFVDGLRSLRNQNQLSSDSVLQLVSQVTATPRITIPNILQDAVPAWMVTGRLDTGLQQIPTETWGTRSESGQITEQVPEPPVSAYQLLERAGLKYETRKFAEGAIRQPQLVAAFQEDPDVLSEMEIPVEEVEWFGAHPRMVDPDDVKSFREIIRQFMSGEIPFPLIYKPNASSTGHGIFFLEKNHDGNVVVTMSHADDARYRDVDASYPVREYMESRGKVKVEADSDGGIIRFILNASDAEEEIYQMWKIITTGEISYDPGMMEEKIDALKFRGHAYETRHYFSGKLLFEDDFSLRKAKEEFDGMYYRPSFARIGSSREFSNVSGRQSAEVLEYPRMYEPLYQMFGIPEDQHQAFEAYVDGQLEEVFHTVRQRLIAQGLTHDLMLDGEFDLMWLPPDETSGGFPIPVLNEMKFKPVNYQKISADILTTGALPLKSFDDLAMLPSARSESRMDPLQPKISPDAVQPVPRIEKYPATPGEGDAAERERRPQPQDVLDLSENREEKPEVADGRDVFEPSTPADPPIADGRDTYEPGNRSESRFIKEIEYAGKKYSLTVQEQQEDFRLDLHNDQNQNRGFVLFHRDKPSQKAVFGAVWLDPALTDRGLKQLLFRESFLYAAHEGLTPDFDIMSSFLLEDPSLEEMNRNVQEEAYLRQRSESRDLVPLSKNPNVLEIEKLFDEFRRERFAQGRGLDLVKPDGVFLPSHLELLEDFVETFDLDPRYKVRVQNQTLTVVSVFSAAVVSSGLLLTGWAWPVVLPVAALSSLLITLLVAWSRLGGMPAQTLLKEQRRIGGKRILEVGTGDGFAGRVLAEHTGAKVTTIEIDEDRYAYAREAAEYLQLRQGKSLPNLKYLQGDFLDYSIAGYDVIYYYFTAPQGHEMSFAEKILEKLNRELRPGQIFVSPLFGGLNGTASSEMKSLLESFQGLESSLIQLDVDYNTIVIRKKLTASGIPELLEEAGEPESPIYEFSTIEGPVDIHSLDMFNRLSMEWQMDHEGIHRMILSFGPYDMETYTLTLPHRLGEAEEILIRGSGKQLELQFPFEIMMNRLASGENVLVVSFHRSESRENPEDVSPQSSSAASLRSESRDSGEEPQSITIEPPITVPNRETFSKLSRKWQQDHEGVHRIILFHPKNMKILSNSRPFLLGAAELLFDAALGKEAESKFPFYMTMTRMVKTGENVLTISFVPFPDAAKALRRRQTLDVTVQDLSETTRAQLSSKQAENLSRLLTEILHNWEKIKASGVLIFDMQKTLTARKEQASEEMIQLLAWLLEQGIRVVINSGNADFEVRQQVLDPLQLHLLNRGEGNLLSRLTAFANSGTLKMEFSRNGRLMIDEDYQQQMALPRPLGEVLAEALKELAEKERFFIQPGDLEGEERLKEMYKKDSEKTGGKPVYQLPWLEAKPFEPSVIVFGEPAEIIQAPYVQRRGIIRDGRPTAYAVTRFLPETRRPIMEFLKSKIAQSFGLGYLSELNITAGGESTIDFFSAKANKAQVVVHYTQTLEEGKQAILDPAFFYYAGDELTMHVRGAITDQDHPGNDTIVLTYNYPDERFKQIKGIAVTPEEPTGFQESEQSRVHYIGGEQLGTELLLKELREAVELTGLARSESREEMDPSILRPKDLKMQQMVLQEIGPRLTPGDRVLEIGTGSGVLTRELAEGVRNADVQFVATDINPEAVEYARQNLQSLGNVEIREGSLFEPVQENEKFKIIFWNPPWYGDVREGKRNDQAFLDENYQLLQRFLEEAPDYLTEDGRVFVIFPQELSEVLWAQAEALGLSIELADAYQTDRFRIGLYEFVPTATAQRSESRDDQDDPYEGFSLQKVLIKAGDAAALPAAQYSGNPALLAFIIAEVPPDYPAHFLLQLQHLQYGIKWNQGDNFVSVSTPTQRGSWSTRRYEQGESVDGYFRFKIEDEQLIVERTIGRSPESELMLILASIDAQAAVSPQLQELIHLYREVLSYWKRIQAMKELEPRALRQYAAQIFQISDEIDLLMRMQKEPPAAQEKAQIDSILAGLRNIVSTVETYMEYPEVIMSANDFVESISGYDEVWALFPHAKKERRSALLLQELDKVFKRAIRKSEKDSGYDEVRDLTAAFITRINNEDIDFSKPSVDAIILLTDFADFLAGNPFNSLLSKSPKNFLRQFVNAATGARSESRQSPDAAESLPINAVLFDLDGVLFQMPPTQERYRRAALTLRERYGVQISANILHHQVMLLNEDADMRDPLISGQVNETVYMGRVNEKLKTFGLQQDLTLQEFMEALTGDRKPVPGAYEDLKRWKEKGVILGVVSNRFQGDEAAWRTLIEKYYPGLIEPSMIFFSSEIQAAKPLPAYYQKVANILQSQKIQPSQTLILDDIRFNLEGAATAGFQTLQFTADEIASFRDVALLTGVEEKSAADVERNALYWFDKMNSPQISAQSRSVYADRLYDLLQKGAGNPEVLKDFKNNYFGFVNSRSLTPEAHPAFFWILRNLTELLPESIPEAVEFSERLTQSENELGRFAAFRFLGILVREKGLRAVLELLSEESPIAARIAEIKTGSIFQYSRQEDWYVGYLLLNDSLRAFPLYAEKGIDLREYWDFMEEAWRRRKNVLRKMIPESPAVTGRQQMSPTEEAAFEILLREVRKVADALQVHLSANVGQKTLVVFNHQLGALLEKAIPAVFPEEQFPDVRFHTARISSREAHRDLFHLEPRWLSDELLAWIAQERPDIIVIDGSNSVSMNDPSRHHLADAWMSTALNLYALDPAHTLETASQAFLLDRNHFSLLEGKGSLKRRQVFEEIRSKVNALAPQAEQAPPYEMLFWPLNESPLYLRLLTSNWKKLPAEKNIAQTPNLLLKRERPKAIFMQYTDENRLSGYYDKASNYLKNFVELDASGPRFSTAFLEEVKENFIMRSESRSRAEDAQMTRQEAEGLPSVKLARRLLESNQFKIQVGVQFENGVNVVTLYVDKELPMDLSKSIGMFFGAISSETSEVSHRYKPATSRVIIGLPDPAELVTLRIERKNPHRAKEQIFSLLAGLARGSILEQRVLMAGSKTTKLYSFIMPEGEYRFYDDGQGMDISFFETEQRIEVPLIHLAPQESDGIYLAFKTLLIYKSISETQFKIARSESRALIDPNYAKRTKERLFSLLSAVDRGSIVDQQVQMQNGQTVKRYSLTEAEGEYRFYDNAQELNVTFLETETSAELEIARISRREADGIYFAFQTLLIYKSSPEIRFERSESRSIAQVLKEAGIDPSQVTVMIYPAAGNYDDRLAVKLKQMFPNLRYIVYNSMSYDPKFGGIGAGESVRRNIVRLLGTEAEGVEIVISPDNYLNLELNDIPQDGIRLWLDKGPGYTNGNLRRHLRNNPHFYLGALRKGHMRVGRDIVLSAGPGPEAFSWQRTLTEDAEVPDYSGWNRWKVSIPSDDDVQTLETWASEWKDPDDEIIVRSGPFAEEKLTIEIQSLSKSGQPSVLDPLVRWAIEQIPETYTPFIDKTERWMRGQTADLELGDQPLLLKKTPNDREYLLVPALMVEGQQTDVTENISILVGEGQMVITPASGISRDETKKTEYVATTGHCTSCTVTAGEAVFEIGGEQRRYYLFAHDYYPSTSANRLDYLVRKKGLVQANVVFVLPPFISQAELEALIKFKRNNPKILFTVVRSQYIGRAAAIKVTGNDAFVYILEPDQDTSIPENGPEPVMAFAEYSPTQINAELYRVKVDLASRSESRDEKEDQVFSFKPGSYELDQMPAVQRAVDVIFEQIIPQEKLKSAKILDAAAGRGLVSAKALRYGASDLTLVDASAEMLQAARQQILQTQQDHDLSAKTTFIEGKLQSLDALLAPAENGNFDYVIAANIFDLFNLENKRQVLDQLRKQLKEGGEIILLVRTVDAEHWLDRSEDAEERYPAKGRHSPQFELYMTEYQQILREAGFEDLEMIRASEETNADWNIEHDPDEEYLINTNVILRAKKMRPIQLASIRRLEERGFSATQAGLIFEEVERSVQTALWNEEALVVEERIADYVEKIWPNTFSNLLRFAREDVLNRPLSILLLSLGVSLFGFIVGLTSAPGPLQAALVWGASPAVIALVTFWVIQRYFFFRNARGWHLKNPELLLIRQTDNAESTRHYISHELAHSFFTTKSHVQETFSYLRARESGEIVRDATFPLGSSHPWHFRREPIPAGISEAEKLSIISRMAQNELAQRAGFLSFRDFDEVVSQSFIGWRMQQESDVFEQLIQMITKQAKAHDRQTLDPGSETEPNWSYEYGRKLGQLLEILTAGDFERAYRLVARIGKSDSPEHNNLSKAIRAEYELKDEKEVFDFIYRQVELFENGGLQRSESRDSEEVFPIQFLDLKAFYQAMMDHGLLAPADYELIDFYHDPRRLYAFDADVRTENFLKQHDLTIGKLRRRYNQAIKIVAPYLDQTLNGAEAPAQMISYEGKEQFLRRVRELGTPSAKRMTGLTVSTGQAVERARSRNGKAKVRHSLKDFQSRSESRDFSDEPARRLEQLKVIQMKVMNEAFQKWTNEDTEYGAQTGFSPTQEGLGSFILTRDLETFLKTAASDASLANRLSFAADLQKARVLVLGPGTQGYEVIELSRYALSEMSVMDILPSNFYGIDENLQREKDLPLISGYLWDMKEPLPELTKPENQFDLIFMADVVDVPHFEEDHVRAIRDNVAAYLKPGGVFMSAGAAFRIHDRQAFREMPSPFEMIQSGNESAFFIKPMVRSESRNDPQKEPEVREAVGEFLTALVLLGRIREDQARKLAQLAQQDIQGVSQAMLELAPLFLDRVTQISESGLDRYFAEQETLRNFFNEDQLNLFEYWAQAYLHSDEKRKLHFAAVVPFEEEETSRALRDLLNRIARVAQREKLNGRLGARVAFLVRTENEESFDRWSQTLDDASMVEKILIDEPVESAKALNRYLEMNSQALVYAMPAAFENRVRPDQRHRIVRLQGLSWKEAFPVTTMISFRTAQETGVLGAELLQKIPESFEFGMVAYENGRLVVLEMARHFALEAAIERYFAMMA